MCRTETEEQTSERRALRLFKMITSIHPNPSPYLVIITISSLLPQPMIACVCSSLR